MAGITYQIFNNSSHRAFYKHGSEGQGIGEVGSQNPIPPGGDKAVAAAGNEVLHIWAENRQGEHQDCFVEFPTRAALERFEGGELEADDFELNMTFDPGAKEFVLSGEQDFQSDIDYQQPVVQDGTINVLVRVKDRPQVKIIDLSQESTVILKIENGVNINIRKMSPESIMMKADEAEFFMRPQASGKFELFVVNKNDR